jgi:hypothetical protein
MYPNTPRYIGIGSTEEEEASFVRDGPGSFLVASARYRQITC